jgi:hypothetical protein
MSPFGAPPYAGSRLSNIRSRLLAGWLRLKACCMRLQLLSGCCIALRQVCSKTATVPLRGRRPNLGVDMKHLLMALTVFVLPVAQSEAASSKRSPLDDLLECRSVPEAAARLACYDKTAATMAAARDNKDVIVVAREEVRESRRRLFGLTLPSLPAFENSSEPELSLLETTLKSAHEEGDGNWIFIVEDDARWRQEDDRTLGYRPKPGQKVVIKRGALGSYWLSVEGHSGLRVRRVN